MQRNVTVDLPSSQPKTDLEKRVDEYRALSDQIEAYVDLQVGVTRVVEELKSRLEHART